MIDIKELMIGDWVNIITTNQPRKISGTNDMLFHDDYEPIILTDEILNKNFSQDTANHQWFIGSADIKCRISMVNDRYSWMEGCKKVYFIELRYNHTEIRKQINFVHELQRCFVLCEYEKEIELCQDTITT